MGLHLLCGGAGTGKSERCLSEIVSYMTGGPSRQAYLIVPDQDAARAEYRLAERFPGGGFTGVRMAGFSQLAHEWLRAARQETRTLSPDGRALVLRRILSEKADDLTFFSRNAKLPHFQQELMVLLRSLSRDRVDDAVLRETQKALRRKSPVLAEKLADLALLAEAYAAKEGTGNPLTQLAGIIPQVPQLEEAHVWIDGFHTMPPLMLSIVKALAGTAAEVTVTVPLVKENRGASFHRPAAFNEALSAMHPTSIEWLETPHRFRDGTLSALASHFFSAAGQHCPQTPTKTAGLHLTTAATKWAEASYIARTIKSLVRDQGLRYRDIAVFLREPDDYADELERAFTLYQVPFYLDKKESAISHPLVVLVRGLLRFLSLEHKGKGRGYRMSLIFSLLKTGLFRSGWKKNSTPAENAGALTAGHIAKLENYVLHYAIPPEDWHRPWTYRDVRDLDNPTAIKPWEQKRLDAINAIRLSVVTALDSLADAWAGAGTVREKCKVLYEWLAAQGVPGKLDGWDERDGSRIHFPLWTHFLALLDAFVSTGIGKIQDEDFFPVLDDGLTALTLVENPPSIDHVAVSGLVRGYNRTARVVFLPGLVEGDFPKRMEPRGLLSEEERKVLSGGGLSLSGCLEERAEEEQFYTYLAFTRASEALYLSYPLTTDDARKATPSALLVQMEHLGYLTPENTSTAAAPDLSGSDLSYLDNPREALALLPALLAGGIPSDRSPWSSLKTWAQQAAPELYQHAMAGLFYHNEALPLPQPLVDRLYLDDKQSFSTSISSLQIYRQCPYRYFLSKGLHLQERDTGRILASDVGSYIHAGLHLFGEYLKQSGRQWKDASDEEIEREIPHIASRISPYMKGGRLDRSGAARFTRRLLDRTLRETIRTLRQWNGQSSFETTAMERSFSFTLPGTPWVIRGKIDRVDRWRDFVSIWDYKTGKENATLDQMRLGIKLQLPTYFLALQADNPALQPAALLYMHILPDKMIRVKEKDIPPAPSSALSVSIDRSEASGCYLEDEDVWQALDHKAGTDDAYVAAIFNKKAKNATKRTPSGKSFNHLDTHQMERLGQMMEANMTAFSREILQGNTAISPYRYENTTGCAYCPYSSICRFDPGNPDETYNELDGKKEKEVWEELKQ